MRARQAFGTLLTFATKVSLKLTQSCFYYPDDPSPLLTIPVPNEVYTPPESTPPAPWMASTGRRDPGEGLRAREKGLMKPSNSLLGRDLRRSLSCLPEESKGDRPSSIGILSTEALATSSGFLGESTFVFPDGSDLSLRQYRTRTEISDKGDDLASKKKGEPEIFKVPALPPSKIRQMGIPQNLMAPSDSFLRKSDQNVSAVNQSSFAWDKILGNESSAEGLKNYDISLVSGAVAVINPELPVDDGTFEKINQSADDSFFSGGQFSARSTSIGGSAESIHSKNGSGGTRDERFSDFSTKNTNFSSSSWSVATGESRHPNPFDSNQGNNCGGCSLVEKGFEGMNQDLGEDFSNKEEFVEGSNAAKTLIDEAEKEFLEEHKLVMYTSNTSSFQHPQQQGSFVSTNSDVLSRSQYFMQNTSRLGFLGASHLAGEEDRPTLGMSKLASPKRKQCDGVSKTEEKPLSDANLKKEVNDKDEAARNSIYPVTAVASCSTTPEVLEQNAKPQKEDGHIAQLQEKLSAFKGMETAQLSQLISQVSPGLDSKAYANIISEFLTKAARTHDNDCTLDNTTLSQFLPSFIEASVMMPDDEGLEETRPNGQEEGRGTFLKSPQSISSKDSQPPYAKSRLPVLSPEAKSPAKSLVPSTLVGSKSKIPVPNQESKSSCVKKGSTDFASRGQRYSSPIKPKSVQQSSTNDMGDTPSRVKKELFGSGTKDMNVKNPASVVAAAPMAPKQRSPLLPINTGTTSRPPAIKVTGCTEKPTMKIPAFPIESDSTSLNFLAVELGRSEEQVLIIRNITASQLAVNLVVRESPDFKLGLTSTKQIILLPHATAEVAVVFFPSSAEYPSRGKLVLKPQGMGSFKATILLQGQGGCPNLKLYNFGILNATAAAPTRRRMLDLGKVSNNNGRLNWNMELSNETGTGAGFFLMQAYRDPECRLPAHDTGFIELNPARGVIIPGERTVTSFMIDLSERVPISNGIEEESGNPMTYLGSLALFYGPELCRRVLRVAQRLPGKRSRLSNGSSQLLAAVDFTGEFPNEDAFTIDLGRAISAADCKHFAEKTVQEVIDLVAHVHHQQLATQFKTLTVEETLSETRIDCTFIQHCQSASPPRLEPIREVASTSKASKDGISGELSLESGTTLMAKLILF